MAASYPGSLKTFTTKTNKVDLVDAAHMNTVQEEIAAVQSELGVDVAGSQTDLVTRLAVMLADNGTLQSGTSFPGSPVEGQLFYRTDTDTVHIYDGSGWDNIGSGAHVAGDILQAYADTEQSKTNDVTYTKVKEILVPFSGELRIKFELRSSTTTNALAQIYRNGSGVGTIQNNATASYVEYSEDISGWSAGDLCQLYYRTGTSISAFVRNFRIYTQDGVNFVNLLD